MPLSHSKRLFSCILTIFLTLAFAGKISAYEESNIHIGAMEFHPFASVKQKYESNIFLEPSSGAAEDFITDFKLGMGIELPLVPQRQEDFMMTVSYEADIIRFWDHDAQNRVDHLASGLLDLTFSNDLRLRIGDNFEKTEDPPDSERTAIEERFQNAFDTTISYDRERIRVQGGFRAVRDDYDDLDNLDRTDNMFTGAIFYQIFPKTSVFAEYNYGMISYDNNMTNSDSEYHQGRLGLEGNLLPKVTGTVKAGYRTVGYDESDKDDFSGFTLYGKIKYNATKRTVINLSAELTSNESSYSTNSYYESILVKLTLDHQIVERFWFYSGGFYGENRYPDETIENFITRKRRDDIWGLNTGMRYEIRRWLYVRTGYEYKERDSNFAEFDYVDHIASVALSVMF